MTGRACGQGPWASTGMESDVRANPEASVRPVCLTMEFALKLHD